MAESTDLGTAIGLGTRMTPDREKPLTTGANTFIKLEMGKTAAAAKAAAAKQKALDAIGSSLKLTGEPVNKHLQREMSHATNQGYFNILNSKSQIDANNNWTSADSVIKSVKQESNREEDIVNGRQKGLLISDLAVQGLNNGDDKEIEKAKSDEGLYGTYTTVPTKGVSSKEDKYTIINHNPVYANINLDNDLEKDVKSYIDSKPLTSTGKTVFGHGEGSRTLTDSDLKIIAARNAQNEQNATTIIDANIGKAREKWAEKQKFYAEKGIDINVDKKAGHQAKTEIAQDLFMDNLRGIAKTKFDYLTPPQMFQTGGSGQSGWSFSSAKDTENNEKEMNSRAIDLAANLTKVNASLGNNFIVTPEQLLKDPNFIAATKRDIGYKYLDFQQKDAGENKPHLFRLPNGNEVYMMTSSLKRKEGSKDIRMIGLAKTRGGKEVQVDIPFTPQVESQLNTIIGKTKGGQNIKIREQEPSFWTEDRNSAPKNRPAKIDVSKLTGVARMKAIQENTNNGY